MLATCTDSPFVLRQWAVVAITLNCQPQQDGGALIISAGGNATSDLIIGNYAWTPAKGAQCGDETRPVAPACPPGTLLELQRHLARGAGPPRL